MIKNEVVYIEGSPYSIITEHAFANDTTARVAMQWLRDHPMIKATIVEIPTEARAQILLPGLAASLPRLQRVVVRCLDWQRDVIERYIPWNFRQKVEFTDHEMRLTLGVVEGRDAEGRLITRVEDIYPTHRM